MSSVPITQKPELTAANRAYGDELYVVDISESSAAAKSKKIKLISIMKIMPSTQPYAQLIENEAIFYQDTPNEGTVKLAIIDEDNNRYTVELS